MKLASWLLWRKHMCAHSWEGAGLDQYILDKYRPISNLTFITEIVCVQDIKDGWQATHSRSVTPSQNWLRLRLNIKNGDTKIQSSSDVRNVGVVLDGILSMEKRVNSVSRTYHYQRPHHFRFISYYNINHLQTNYSKIWPYHPNSYIYNIYIYIYIYIYILVDKKSALWI